MFTADKFIEEINNVDMYILCNKWNDMKANLGNKQRHYFYPFFYHTDWHCQILWWLYSWDFHGCFLYKNYAFCGFRPCPDPFLERQRFVNLAVHFIRARSSLILSCSSRPFLFILHYLLEWWGGRRQLWVRRRGKLVGFQKPGKWFSIFYLYCSYYFYLDC